MGVLPEILFRYPQFKAMQKLTATAVKQAKPKAKPYKLADARLAFPKKLNAMYAFLNT